MNKLTLVIYLITERRDKKLIKNSVCSSSQEIVIPVPVSILLYEISSLYSDLVELSKICQKRWKFMTGYIQKKQTKACLKPNFCHFLSRRPLENFQ